MKLRAAHTHWRAVRLHYTHTWALGPHGDLIICSLHEFELRVLRVAPGKMRTVVGQPSVVAAAAGRAKLHVRRAKWMQTDKRSTSSGMANADSSGVVWSDVALLLRLVACDDAACIALRCLPKSGTVSLRFRARTLHSRAHTDPEPKPLPELDVLYERSEVEYDHRSHHSAGRTPFLCGYSLRVFESADT